MVSIIKNLFELGQVVITQDALEAFNQAGQEPSEFINRHVNGDWGELTGHDKQANEQAVVDGERILSAYTLKSGVKIRVITEGDRSATTVMRAEDY